MNQIANNTNNTNNNQNITPVNTMKSFLQNKGIQEMFENTLKENANAFMSSIIDVYSGDTTLAKCDPKEVVMEALKAATLKLPINKNLGFAYIVPYNKRKKVDDIWVDEPHPQFQLGYKGYIQLAMRSGQYKTINANEVYEGMEVEEDYLSGEIKIKGKKESDKVIGYFSYFKLINGFEKAVYWTIEQVREHANRFSQSYKAMIYAQNDTKRKYNPDYYVWDVNFNEMALKTLVKRLLSKYGILSTEMQNAVMQETDLEFDEIKAHEANSIDLGEVIDVDTGEILNFELSEEEKKAILAEEERQAREEASQKPSKAPF